MVHVTVAMMAGDVLAVASPHGKKDAKHWIVHEVLKLMESITTCVLSAYLMASTDCMDLDLERRPPTGL